MKNFIIIGNLNAVTYKEVFPYIKEGKLKAGYTFNKSLIYKVFYENDLECNRKFVSSKGLNPNEYIKVPAICFYTNFNIYKEPLILTKQYNPEEYPKYDKYDAIEVGKVVDIPMDYNGIMGVPITFLDKYCPAQFEIVGLDRYVEDNPKYGYRFTINGKETYARILIQKI